MLNGKLQCAFAITGDNERTCQRCGRVLRTTNPPDRIFAPCRQPAPPTTTTPATTPAPTPPPIVTQITSFAVEHAKWLAAGCPLRTPIETARIHTDLCQRCEHYQRLHETAGYCDLCGCNLRPAGRMLNKIAMATAHCPIKKW